MSAQLGSENADPALLIVDGDSLDRAGQHLLLRCLRFRLHPGIDCRPRGLREHFPMRFSRGFRCRSQGVTTFRTLGGEIRGLVSRLNDDCPHTVSGDSLHPADNARPFSGCTEHSTRLRQFLACGSKSAQGLC